MKKGSVVSVILIFTAFCDIINYKLKQIFSTKNREVYYMCL